MFGVFHYFGYGSNLLHQRILLQNPTAQFVSIGKVDNFKLDFDYESERWKGAAATIKECPGKCVWGVVWRMNVSDRDNIDDQEGVHKGTYKPIEIQVCTPGGEELSCRSYQLLKTSQDKQPSPQYLDVVIQGALQNSLPEEYIKQLQNIHTNGYDGDVPIYNEIMKNLEK